MAEKHLPYKKMEEFLKAGNVEEPKRLFSQCEPNAVNYSGSNVFALSPMLREFALWAQEQGADINFRDKYGYTPIFEVIRRDGDVSLLIELGADIEAVSSDGRTPLHAAAARGRKKQCRALLKAGARVDVQTKDFGGFGHFTPL